MSDTLTLPDPVALPRAPHVPEVLRAVGGFALMGLAAGLGSADPAVATGSLPSGLLVGGGALLLSGPALLVAHQYLQLSARPEVLGAALVRGFVEAGRLCLGFAPFVLFFSATSGLAGVLYGLLLAAIGLLGLGIAVRDLQAAERASGEGSLYRDARMALLTWAWAVLAAVIALRIGWDVLWFVIG